MTTPALTATTVARDHYPAAAFERAERTLTYLYGKIVAWVTGVIPTRPRSFLMLPYDYDTHHEPFPVNGGDEDFVFFYIGDVTDTPDDPPQPYEVDRFAVDRDADCYYLGKTSGGLPVFAFVTSHSLKG